MQTRVGLLLTALLVAGSTCLAVPADASRAVTAASGRPVRIMVDGDSITQGYDGDVNWRYRLWRELRRQRVSVDMVGPYRNPFLTPGFRTTRYAMSGWDSDHASLARAKLVEMRNRIRAQVSRYQPDVVVVAGGLNDIRHRRTPTVLLDILSQYVANARAAKPDVRIIVSPVLPNVDPKYSWVPVKVREFDRLLPARIAQLTTPQSPVIMAPTLRAWNERAFTWDGTHPNPVGEVHMAKRIVEGLVASRAVPGLRTPAITPVRYWQRYPPIRVAVRAGRVQLAWDAQRISYARIWIKRPGSRAKVLVGTGGWHSLRTSSFKRGKTYTFRVQLVRRTMVTPYGPPTRMKLSGHRRR